MCLSLQRGIKDKNINILLVLSLLVVVVVVVLLVTLGVMYDRAGSIIDVVNIILFDGENISFDANLVMYINSTSIPPMVIMNRMYENQHLLYIVPLMRHPIVVCINSINTMALRVFYLCEY
jgi:hypothetical protein